MQLQEAHVTQKRKRLRAGGAPERKTVGVMDRLVTDLPFQTEVQIVLIDDPESDRPGAKTDAIASLRDDPLQALRSRNQIDDAQYLAGRHWQGLYERSMIVPLKAMDTTKEPVDGSGETRIPITDSNLQAIAELNRGNKALGTEGMRLVFKVLAERRTIQSLASDLLMGSQRDRDFLGRRFRECLETLAVVYGLAMKERN